MKISTVALAIVILAAGITAQIFLGEEIGVIGDYFADDDKPSLKD